MIKQSTIEAIAATLTVPAHVVYGVVMTESSGQYAWGGGKIPILLERHWTYRLLEQEKSESIARQYHKRFPDICNPRAGGYGRYDEQYSRLAKAIKMIDEEIAHKATSFGAFQIMGFNHKIAGFESAKAMSDSFHLSADNQVEGFMIFIANYQNGKVREAMKNENYHDIAYRYNGPKYKENKYAEKMQIAAAAYLNDQAELAS